MKIKVGDYIAGFDANASKEFESSHGFGLNRDLNTIKGLISNIYYRSIYLSKDHHVFIELITLQGHKVTLEFREGDLSRRMIPYEFTVLGGLNEFKKEFMSTNKINKEFWWNNKYHPQYVETADGVFTLNALAKGIVTPIKTVDKLPKYNYVESTLPLYRW